MTFQGKENDSQTNSNLKNSVKKQNWYKYEQKMPKFQSLKNSGFNQNLNGHPVVFKRGLKIDRF